MVDCLPLWHHRGRKCGDRLKLFILDGPLNVFHFFVFNKYITYKKTKYICLYIKKIIFLCKLIKPLQNVNIFV